MYKAVKSAFQRSKGCNCIWPSGSGVVTVVITALESTVLGRCMETCVLQALVCYGLAAGFVILDTWISERETNLEELEEQQK